MLRIASLAVSALAATLLCACPDSEPVNQGGAGQSNADAGPECPSGPTAMYNLTIHVANSPVPADTTLAVSWSAGDEPPFSLADPQTWGSLDQGANVVCDVDPSAPPPTDLPALVCHLWTSGATYVEVKATGYTAFSSTLTPKIDPACKSAVPRNVDVLLVPLPDGGAAP